MFFVHVHQTRELRGSLSHLQTRENAGMQDAAQTNMAYIISY